MVGGAHRGPVAHSRQRRTLRLVQGLLVLIAAGLLLFAGYGLGKSAGYDEGRRAGDIGGPEEPSLAAVIVPALLALGALTGALYLQGQGGIRMPTPARLDELAGRAEQVAIEKVQGAAAANPPLEERAEVSDATKPRRDQQDGEPTKS